MEYLPCFQFQDRQAAERFLAWFENRIKQESIRCGWPIALVARIEETAEGFFQIEGTEFYNGMRFRFNFSRASRTARSDLSYE